MFRDRPEIIRSRANLLVDSPKALTYLVYTGVPVYKHGEERLLDILTSKEE